MTSRIQKVRKWRLMVKILRKNMRDVLFLDVSNQANFKYAPKKRWLFGELLSAKYTKRASKVQ